MNTSLRGKYCIAGVGETEFSRGSNRTTRAMGAEAIRNAMNDAGLKPEDVDGMLSYHGGDSTPSTSIMYDLGLRPNFYMDWSRASCFPKEKGCCRPYKMPLNILEDRHQNNAIPYDSIRL